MKTYIKPIKSYIKSSETTQPESPPEQTGLEQPGPEYSRLKIQEHGPSRRVIS